VQLGSRKILVKRQANMSALNGGIKNKPQAICAHSAKQLGRGKRCLIDSRQRTNQKGVGTPGGRSKTQDKG